MFSKSSPAHEAYMHDNYYYYFVAMPVIVIGLKSAACAKRT